jgi:two-component system sensor histidine kinase KdpD
MAGHPRPPLPLGIVTAALSLALTTLLFYPLSDVAPAVSLGVLYLLAVLLVSTLWGLSLGVATGIAAAAAFNWFHLPPTGRFAIAEAENWVALLVFLVAAVVASSLAELARARARDAQQRRREADLAAELARLLLGSPAPRTTLPVAAQRIADALELESAAVVLEPVNGDGRRAAVPLRDGTRRLGTLVVPMAAATIASERVAPALEAVLAAALEREALINELVETSALRRSDEIKTAVLRSVSHDLRSPLTAILAASEALASPALEAEERTELADAITQESRRLSRLVDQLIDLSRLQAGTAAPREDWCSVEEVIRAAVEDTGVWPNGVRLEIDPDLPLVRADATQLRRAIANLIDNALRHGAGAQVSVRARVSAGQILIGVVDEGPGIPLEEQDRIFTAFYRAPGAVGHGSGLGLAIVRGLVEANAGHVRVESPPGQGSAFVVELPLAAPVPVAGTLS